MTDLTYHGAEKAIKWAKKVVKGGYASGAENNEKRVNMKVLIRMAIIQLKQMKEEQNGQN